MPDGLAKRPSGTGAPLPPRPVFEQALAEALLGAARVDRAGLERARKACEAGARTLETALAQLGLVDEAELARAAAGLLGLAVAGPGDWPADPVLEAELGRAFLGRARALPLAETPDEVILAMADPLDAFARRSVELACGRRARVLVAAPSDIAAQLERLDGAARAARAGVEAAGVGEEDAAEDEARLRDLASEAPVVRLVNRLIAEAIEVRASDIHVEPARGRLGVRYRIDGLLRDAPAPPPALRAAVLSRIKIMAKLNIAERRLPQDGRILFALRGKEYDLRVATVPTLHGERVTMRVLDRASLVGDFASLGFSEHGLRAFLGLVDRPHGIVLVTGPTGSGKTTTLYTALRRLNLPERNLFTVEDPVEYQLEGVNQVQVKPQIGFDFPGALRTLLRHNPDIVMVGEMRDLETAQVGIQFALTGHLVLSTLHTNDAASSITRLLDMGVPGFLVTSTLNGAMAQRLVRRLCTACRRPRRALPEEVERMRLGEPDADGHVVLHAPAGCPACLGTGYQGQTAISEVLAMSDGLRRLVLRQAEAQELRRAAVEEGMLPMYDDGVAKARAGETSIDEVLRVTRDV
jgi:general secretion pathway protein E